MCFLFQPNYPCSWNNLVIYESAFFNHRNSENVDNKILVLNHVLITVRSLLFGLPRYVLIFQSLNKTESLLVPIL